MWAAEVAARGGLDTLVLEKTARTGTKVLASGGTRCNLTTTLEAEGAARLFRGRGERFLRRAFGALSPLDVRARFATWGVETVEDRWEKVFPASDRARDVRDALEGAARAAGARFVLGSGATAVERGSAEWIVHTADGSVARAPRLLLSTGGSSYPRSGTTGDGYRFLRELDLPVHELAPALVPLTSPAAWAHELSGIAWQQGECRLRIGGKVVARRRRPLLFTREGVSGPGPMDLSVHVARREREGDVTLLLDLFPDVESEQLREGFLRAAGAPKAPRLSRALPERVPARLFAAVLAATGLPEDGPAARLDRQQRHELIEVLKGLPIPIDGTAGFDKAEVTTGGLDLRALDPHSCEVRGHEGLFVIGELLDLDGPIGGLNFQAAFSCAELAGRALLGS